MVARQAHNLKAVGSIPAPSTFFAGSGLRHLQKDAFKKHKIVLPPEFLINRFNDIADQSFKRISETLLENQSLSDLQDFILPMFMNGQLGTNNISKKLK